jgi:CRISPR-associated protein Cas1
MEIVQNTLFVLNEGAYLSKDHETIQVIVDGATKMSIPFHLVESVAIFGGSGVSPHLMNACAERGIGLTFLSYTGRLLARVDAPNSGSHQLRRAQFQATENTEISLSLSRSFVAGKIQNARTVLQRGKREQNNAEEVEDLERVIKSLSNSLFNLKQASTIETVRGIEGDAARSYFSVFNLLLKKQRDDFLYTTRTRRPPLDRINALLSFVYTLLLHDCTAALTAVGFDPNFGFLHADRPNRPSLSLDLLEEFRPIIADKVVISMINLRQIQKQDFIIHSGGAVEMKEEARKRVIEAYQKRKQEGIVHPLLGQQTTVGRLPFLQARILARVIRGDISEYIPCILR